ncbi:Plasma membrane fusion protein [Phanerochaete sordida]|uniref:Plasma membrane fusion protein PRM1 n=1 Tax=Phanerochaete sordida TaxID=48140 RepID=A0A9P3GN00_9APHY|nr:Plasma membrane fusion protein [Phanerochaete sordida]
MSATPPVYDPRSTQYTTTLTPYLQLPHLLSLTWLAYPILSLLFVAFRLQLSSASAQDAVTNAKDDLLASCQAAEKAATAAASMPRYMAAATNVRIAEAVNGTMNGARAALVLALTVMEAIINFIVDLYRSTFLCFLELVVRGALSILIGAVQEFNSFLTSTFSTIRTAIQNDIQAANSVITTAINAINKVNPFGNISAPQISVPSLDSLQNVTLPSDFQDALEKLNSSLPTISDLKSKIDDLIDTPFELVKKDINDTFANLSFDASVLPVPAQNTVEFCGDMDTSVVDDLGHDLVKIAKIGTVILIAVAILLICANCALEWYKWRCLKNHLRYTREAWTSDPSITYTGSKSAPTVHLSDHNLMMLQGNMQHPLLTRIANRIARLLRFSPSQYIHLTWFFHYVFHPPALACFLIGFFGLLSVQIQLIAIGPLEHKYSQQAVASVSDFQNTIATSMNASMYNQSAAYANDINGRVDNIQNTVNDGLFGWVNGTTTTLNDTINAFYTDIQDAVNTVFNGTILDEPIQEFIRCFIGSKVDAIETALTFLHDNLVIDIPRVNDSVLVLSPSDVREATQPIADAAIGGGSGDSQGVVGKLVNAYVSSLKKERIMFGIFMGLWGLVVLMALAVIFWHAYGRDWAEAYKKRRWRKTQRAGIDGVVVPFRDFGSTGARSPELGGDAEKMHHVSLPPFAPRAMSPTDKNMLHPYGENRNPTFGKSWESFLDQAHAQSPPEPKPRPAISSPRKLHASPTTSPTQASSDSPTEPWLKRFTQSFWRRKGSTDDEPAAQSPAPGGSPRARTRPELTVTTSEGSIATLTNADEEPAPGSAWSVSPRRPGWLATVASVAPPKLPTLRPKARARASVPVDVGVTPSAPAAAPSPLADVPPFAVPLHHGSARTPPPAPSMQFPAYAAPVSPPPPKLRAPHLSALDPFATPFDDRYAVPHEPSAGRKNPFVVM